MKQETPSNKKLLLQYAGFAFQLMAALGVATFAGYYADKWIKTTFPIFLWLLPLAVLIIILWKAVKDTSKK